MRRLSLVMVLFLGQFVLAGDQCCQKAKAACPVGEKVTTLITAWKAVSEAHKGMCPVERAKIQADFALADENCALGPRMGETLELVRAVLAASSCGKKDCASPGQTAAGTCAEGSKLVEARDAMVRDLQQLTSFALEALPPRRSQEGKPQGCAASATAADQKGCQKSCSSAAQTTAQTGTGTAAQPAAACGQKAGGLGCKKGVSQETTASAAAPGTPCCAAAAGGCCGKKDCMCACPQGGCPCGKKECCADCKCADCKCAGCTKEGACCSSLSAKAKALKASWDQVPGQLASMCPMKKKDLLTATEALEQRSKAAALIPQTALALADGLEAVDGLNGKMAEWLKANPGALSEDARKRFERQAGLLREAKEVLSSARVALQGTKPAEATDKEAVAVGG